jgi:hypothetical protein
VFGDARTAKPSGTPGSFVLCAPTARTIWHPDRELGREAASLKLGKSPTISRRAGGERGCGDRQGARWPGVRGTKSNPVEGEHLLFGFLTTEPNDIVAPVHTKAMPVVLTTADEVQTWMSAPAEEAPALQRPLPDGALKIVARGERKAEAVAVA